MPSGTTAATAVINHLFPTDGKEADKQQQAHEESEGAGDTREVEPTIIMTDHYPKEPTEIENRAKSSSEQEQCTRADANEAELQKVIADSERKAHP